MIGMRMLHVSRTLLTHTDVDVNTQTHQWKARMTALEVCRTGMTTGFGRSTGEISRTRRAVNSSPDLPQLW